MEQQLEVMLREARQAMLDADNEADLQNIRVQYLGKKGRLTAIMKDMGKLSAEQRPVVGAIANKVKDDLSEVFETRMRTLKQQNMTERLQREHIDVTLPGRHQKIGSKHPVTLITEELVQIFSYLGFSVAEGPEIEEDFYNFEALNLPRDHPARDMQDTFYISDNEVLRTHTSPVQIRSMLKHQPPLRIIAPGTVYRRDSDITHSPMFHQIEGFMVDEHITFGDLKGILTAFITECFGKNVGVRFRP
jgi:phenylalanyl-tRNA synthetase alpha chain